MSLFHLCRSNTLRLALALTLIASAGFIHADTTIKDQFGLKERTAGQPLNKTAAESGDTAWQATPNLLLDSDAEGGFVTVNDPQPYVGRVAIPATAKVISVEAKVQPVLSKWAIEKGLPGNWIALGIGNPQLGTPAWGKGVFVYIDPKGNFNCSGDPDPADFRSKSIVAVKAGKAPEFNPDQPNRLKFEYNREGNTISLWINGVQALDKISLEGRGFTVEPAYAGFSGIFQETKSRAVSDFTVTCTP